MGLHQSVPGGVSDLQGDRARHSYSRTPDRRLIRHSSRFEFRRASASSSVSATSGKRRPSQVGSSAYSTTWDVGPEPITTIT